MIACILNHVPPSHYEAYIPQSENFTFQTLDELSHLKGSSQEVTRIYFIRNGESLLNVEDENGKVLFTSGKSKNVELTERGKGQAQELGTKLGSKIEGLDVVIHPSASLRAEQTAVELNLGIVGKSLEGLCELGMGPWEGLPKDEAYKQELQKWKDLPSAQEKYSTVRVAGGESFQETADRALQDLQNAIEKEGGKTIFIISHDHTINALALHWMGPLSKETGSDLPLFSFGNCDLLMVEIPKGETVENAHLKMFIQSGV
ncbi:MAG TPA: histidine phosphatase family protein [Chlamydiales bacterium]|nr:histidine phosphatase family protein [Chlamydiales bacterium]